METNKETIMVGIISLILIVPMIWFSGFTISTLWFWFLVPLGIPAISVLNAMGIAVLLRFPFARMEYFATKRSADDKYSALIFEITYPFLALGMGWIIHYLMT